MSSRVVAFLVSLMLFASSVMAGAPAIAAPDQHALVVIVAADQDDLPVSTSSSHDQVDTLLDVPDQLPGPSAIHGAALAAYRMEPHQAAHPTHPDLEGLQRPPRATA